MHVGFVDAGCQTMNEAADAWLHGHLASGARELVGLDLDRDSRRQLALRLAGGLPAQWTVATPTPSAPSGSHPPISS